jgi:hypothetical protein
MRRYLSTILTILASVLLFSCEKDKALEKRSEKGNADCVTFNTSECVIGPVIRKKMPAYERAVFDPVDGDELILERKVASSEYDLVKYDLSSGALIQLKDQIRIASDLTWSVQGWIAFSGLDDWNIWKIREDGSGLTQLADAPQALSPEFYPEGKKLIYSRRMEYSNYDLENDPSLYEDYKIMTIDLNGTELDSFCREDPSGHCYPWYKCSMAPDGNRIAAPDEKGLPDEMAIYDLNGERLSYDFDFFGKEISKIVDIEWHPDNERVFFIYRNGGADIRGGIVVWHLSSGQTRIMRKGCDNRNYIDLSISPDGERLVAIRRDSEMKDCKIIDEARPVIMEIDGSDERVLEVD